MTTKSFFYELSSASSKIDFTRLLTLKEEDSEGPLEWAPIGGKENNRGPIEIAADPGRSLVERLTNGIDAILEAEHERHRGIPDCRSPREAAVAWIGVSERGLSEMTPAQRQTIANRVTIKILEGEGKESRIIEIRDNGIGIRPEDMHTTILSLNESNKIKKHYVAGTYGQGGSSTFAISTYTLISSKREGDNRVAYTIVKFLDLPPEEYKTGHYVFFTLSGVVPSFLDSDNEIPYGTLVRHIGYDLSGYSSPLGPTSLYGLLNQVLFDPIMPIWLDSRIHNYRRVIKGSRNALNGAVDDGDDNRRGPSLVHNIPMFFVPFGDYGSVSFEYWVLESPNRENKRPTAAFVNPSRPIILTLNGQNHAELSQSIVKKDAELPYLAQRLIIHINCDSLAPTAKRALFSSSREDVRRGTVLQQIQDELIRILRSDDELSRINNEAREQGMRDRDEGAVQEMRREVAKILRLQGIDVGIEPSVRSGNDRQSNERSTRPGPTHRPLIPLAIQEPPTYIRIVWAEDEPVMLYPGQRRYIRVETDANSNYHDAENPALSKINFVVEGPIQVRGTTPLRGGRMRVIIEAKTDATIGSDGLLCVELARLGLSRLSDLKEVSIREMPPVRDVRTRITLPPFEIRAIGPDDDQWNNLGWPDDVSQIASATTKENGTLIIYYSTAFPKYDTQLRKYEQRGSDIAHSFTKRYEVWLAAHSLLYYQDQEKEASIREMLTDEINSEILEKHEQEERCRMAILSSLFASREIAAQSEMILESEE